jgi:protein O-GlcNAc transferase
LFRKVLNRLASRKAPDSGAAVSFIDEADRLIAAGDRAGSAGAQGEACEQYRQAAAIAPRYAKAWLNLGVGQEAVGDADGAMKSYETALLVDPENAYANYNLGKLLYTRGELSRAEALLHSALANKPEFPEAQVVLSSIYEAQADLTAAALALEVALKQRPDWAGALCNYGTVLKKLGRLNEAEVALRRAIALDPQNVDAVYSLANILAEGGRRDESISSYQKALTLRPNFPEAHCTLGNAFSDQGRWDEAFACYKKSVELKPDFPEGYVGLGNVLKQRDQFDDAITCYKKALALKPDFPEALCNLGGAYRDQDYFDEALDHFKKALSLWPESADVRWLFTMCQIPAVYGTDSEPERFRSAFSLALEELDRWFAAPRLTSGFSAVGNQQPFYLAYQEKNNQELLRRYGGLCARVMSNWFDRQGFVPSGPRDAASVIRVGIVSGHFYNHPVWNAIVKGWFQKLDRERFAIHAFYLGLKEDPETRIASSRATDFQRGDRGLRQWVEAILDRQLDVLIYPEISMDPMTLKLASLRLAPVQVATWGHPQTTGLKTMDYYLSAEDLEPPDAQESYTERLISLPHLGCWYQPSRVDPVDPDFAALGIDPTYPLLLCPGTPFKYAPQHDWILTEIAHRLGRCRFIFFTHNVRNMSEKLRRRLEAAFTRSQLNFDDFVTFIPWQSPPKFYGWLKRADVFLDTIGFSGFNTAMQAVECAAPIVTKEGRFMRGRLASGILRRMGVPELVAQSEEDYIALAVRLAKDADYRGHVRHRIEKSRSVLFEDIAPIRALEDFLAEATTRHRIGPRQPGRKWHSP